MLVYWSARRAGTDRPAQVKSEATIRSLILPSQHELTYRAYPPPIAKFVLWRRATTAYASKLIR